MGKLVAFIHRIEHTCIYQVSGARAMPNAVMRNFLFSQSNSERAQMASCIGAGFCLHQFRNKQFVDRRGNARRVVPCDFICVPIQCSACLRFVPEFLLIANNGRCDFCRLRGTQPDPTRTSEHFHTVRTWPDSDSTKCW